MLLHISSLTFNELYCTWEQSRRRLPQRPSSLCRRRHTLDSFFSFLLFPQLRFLHPRLRSVSLPFPSPFAFHIFLLPNYCSFSRAIFRRPIDSHFSTISFCANVPTLNLVTFATSSSRPFARSSFLRAHFLSRRLSAATWRSAMSFNWSFQLTE